MTEDIIIAPLDVYEKLDIETDQLVSLPYSLRAQNLSDCADVKHDGFLRLKEKTANSYFVTNGEVYNFTDNNDKAIDGVNVR